MSRQGPTARLLHEISRTTFLQVHALRASVAGMPRQKITPGNVGDVAVVPLGFDTSDPAKREVVIPQQTTDDGRTLEHPKGPGGKGKAKGLQRGHLVKVDIEDRGLVEFEVTRWRGLARVVDVIEQDEHGKDVRPAQFMVRVWRDTKAEAKNAAKDKGAAKLAQRARAREAQAKAKRDEAAASAAAEQTKAIGDVTTTVADLVERVLASPEMAKRAAKTQSDYHYAARHITEHPIAAMLPRDVDVATVKGFLVDCAAGHGAGGTKHARAVLRRALQIAVETSALKTPSNPMDAARGAIPAVIVRTSTLDHAKAPTDAEVAALLSGLTRDLEARAMYPGHGRRKSKHGEAGTETNGKDIADLTAVMFATGTRIGETAALRWVDYNPTTRTVMVSGTLTNEPGRGTVRQERTKTAGSTRLVPLAPWAAAALRRRARRFGVDLDNLPATPIFGSPQFPDRWRDQRNLSRAVSELFSKHGIDYGRGHTGRKWRITSLVERGIPTHKVADLVGHGSVSTTLGYLGRGRQTDADVIAAL